jgi:ABC-type antimicrobial peptide transport system permease subunit
MIVLRNLWRRPVRTTLTMLGIAIGVAAVVSLGAMAEGFMRNYNSAVGVDTDILVSQANAYDMLFSTIDEGFKERIQAVPGVEAVEPGVYTWIATEQMPFFLLFGYEPGSAALRHYRIVEGKPVTAPKQIAIGRRAADSLKLEVGDNLRLYGAPYHVVGIFETGQAMEESGGTVTLSDAQSITKNPRKVSLFQVGLRRGSDADQALRRIENIDKTLTATQASEYKGNESYTAMIQGFAWGIAAIAVLVGGLGMMNAMVMSVLERTREIGTLRALGWSRRRVLGMILGESVVLGVAGGLAGLGLGLLLTELAAQVPGIGAFMEGAYTSGVLLQGLLTAVCLGLVGGLYPALHAANLQPVEALRYEGGGAQVVPGVLARFGGQSFRNLWRRRGRTLFSATGIGIGVGTLVMLGGFTKGMIAELNGLAGSGGQGNITLMQAKAADIGFSALDESMVSQVKAMPGVKSVSPMLIGFVSTPEMPMFVLGGLDPNSSAMAHYKLVAGRYVQRPNEIVLGKTAAKNYKLNVGDTLALYSNRYQIVGIVGTGVAMEDGAGMLALREAQRLLNRPRSVSFIFVDVERAADAESVRRAIAGRFTDVQASLSSEFAQDSEQLAQLDAMSAAISLLALIVAGIVVANTMFMSIYERTREIGTLRALGWSSARILEEIVQESLLLCLLAGIMGSVLGMAMLWGITKLPGVDAFISMAWDASATLRAILLSLLVGLLAGLYPAWRASRLHPVEALRYE